MAGTTDCLTRAEAHLGALTRGNEQTTLARWRDSSTELADADLVRPVQLRGWLGRCSTGQADEVLRGLIRLAQRGDTVALLAVVVSLSPGIRALARRTGIGADEAMSEVTLGILEYPVDRRRSIAGGLLLDARNRLGRAARRRPTPVAAADDTVRPIRPDPATDPGEPTAAERVLQLLCEARRRNLLTHDETQLIVDTRLTGRRVAPAAARLGISSQAAYRRRARAEERLTGLA